jgi:hypothetical protein
MDAGGTPFKKGQANPRARKSYSKPPTTLEEFCKRAKGVDCGGLPAEVGFHVSITKRLQPAVRSAVLTAYGFSKNKKKLSRVLMRKDPWLGLALKRERDAATDAVKVTPCEVERPGSGADSASHL